MSAKTKLYSPLFRVIVNLAVACQLLGDLNTKSWSNTGALMEAIKKDFGSFESFKERFSTATIAVQGSGWGWLVSKSKIVTLQ